MTQISVPSPLIAPRTTEPLAPAMLASLWEIAAVLDERRVPAVVADAIWLEIPTRRLRGKGGRDDNGWLRKCLDRLTGIKLSGEYRGDPWGAVMVAEWSITKGGSIARILIPPSAIQALRSPSTFAKIETTAAHRLSGHARRLYVILADKKRLGRPTWTFTLDEIRSLLDVDGKRSYDRWNNFQQWVLDPAVSAINAYGTVSVTMTPQKLGRSVIAVRFDWRWKNVDEARQTEDENERHSDARGREPPQEPDAPPLVVASAARSSPSPRQASAEITPEAKAKARELRDRARAQNAK